MPNNSTSSLLGRKSTGGEHARRGFEFQDQYFVSQIPYWLVWDGFSQATQEAVGDIEVKMYSPLYGTRIELIEVKNHYIRPAEFWNVIDRFCEVDKESPNTFQWFTLVAVDFSQELAPLRNSLRRLRFNYGFYSQDSGVAQNSMSDFRTLVKKWKKPEYYADFLYYRVSLEVGRHLAQEQGNDLFRQNLERYLPEYRNLPYEAKLDIYRELLSRFTSHRKPVRRMEIEEAIRTHIPTNYEITHRPTHLHTIFEKYSGEYTELVLDWRAFSGNGRRVYPDTVTWNSGVVEKLNEIRNFIEISRSTKHIRLTGNRRLSATLAIGSVFSATAGFCISMEYRNRTWWHTDDHAGEDDLLNLVVEHPVGQCNDLYVAIGIPCSIRPSVEGFARSQGRATEPILNIVYPNPIQCAQQGNAFVAQVKEAMGDSLTSTKATKIHLFCRIPSFVALLLGHRLNATATIQCYEFTESNTYVPSCLLRT